jgi:hypothetical protein
MIMLRTIKEKYKIKNDKITPMRLMVLLSRKKRKAIKNIIDGKVKQETSEFIISMA